MTCYEIAGLVEKRHDNTKRTIETLAKSGVIRLPQIEVFEEINNLGFLVKREQYVFAGPQGKRDSIIVVAQLSPEFTARLVDRWQELEAQVGTTPTLPDFSSPAAAARAWADAYEAEQAAKAQVLALEHQITQDQPYTELAKAITGSSTMYVRDWIALMKEDHQASFKESQVREFLHEAGYWYWTQTTPKATRAYGHFSHLFKLEVEMINGYPRDVLKITGQGVLELTPVIINFFAGQKSK